MTPAFLAYLSGVSTRWDARLFARAALVAAFALALGWLVTAATDEGGIGWGERAGRTLPLTPVCAAIGAWVALAPVRARGEARALAAMGRSRAQIAAAAVAGAALVALAAALAIGLIVRVDVGGFYPTATRASAWGWEGGAFVDRAQGLRVGEDGAPVRLAAEGVASLASIPPHGRAAAAVATALAGIALPLLLAHALLGRPPQGVWGPRDRRLTREDAAAALAAGAAMAASVFLFQAAAARQAPALLGAIPPLALLAFAVRRYRASP